VTKKSDIMFLRIFNRWIVRIVRSTRPSNDDCITIDVGFSDGGTMRDKKVPWQNRREIGAARAIWHRLFGRLAQRMPFRRRTHGGSGGPLSCKTATRISNPDTIAIRTGGSWGERRHKGAGFEKSNRAESMFLPSIINADATIFFPCFFFLFTVSFSHLLPCDNNCDFQAVH